MTFLLIRQLRDARDRRGPHHAQINEIAENLAQERLSFDTTQAGFEVRLDSVTESVTCPVTGLTAIEELQEALSENTSAIAVLQGHVIPRVVALENTIIAMPDLTMFAGRARVDALENLVATLPKQLAISRLGGRITNLDERMHSLAGTFTDHEELTQVRQEQLRTELLIRLDPPVL